MKMRAVFPAWCAAMLAASASLAQAAPNGKPLGYEPGEIVVTFAAEALQGGVPGPRAAASAATDMAALTTRAEPLARIATTMAEVGRGRKALVRFPSTMPVGAMVERFRTMPGVEHVEPNYLAHAAVVPRLAVPPDRQRMIRGTDGRSQRMTPREIRQMSLAANNDPELANQGGWSWIRADVVWPDAKANPTIAILDTGVDYLHPDLRGRVIRGGDWVGGTTDPMDDNGHGTHVAGIAAAGVNNKVGVAGVSKARVYAIKVLDAEGSGTYFRIEQGLYQAANNPGVRVISLSLGGPNNSLDLEAAVDYAVNTKGRLVVAAAGNEGADVPSYPAFFANSDPSGSAFCAPSCPTFPALAGKVMAVAADGVLIYTDATHTALDPLGPVDYACKAQYSNFGPWVTISAPGSLILSTTPVSRPFWLETEGLQAGYDYLDGTSMATPMVAGAAARVLSATPALTNAQVAAQLVGTGVDLSSSIGVQIDQDGNGIDVDDPECWPTGNSLSMTDADVAAAMGRGEVFGMAFDAVSGTRLSGARVTALLGKKAQGFGGVVETSGDETYRIVNLPVPNDYTFKIQKTKYTVGAQAFLSATLSGESTHLPNVSVPTSKNWFVVTDWEDGSFSGPELDEYAFTPVLSPAPCWVGFNGLCGSGSLTTAPFMMWRFDGGPSVSAVNVRMESLQIRPPLYTTKPVLGAPNTPYELFLDSYGSAPELLGTGALARIWLNGVIRATVDVAAAVDLGDCTTDDCGWHIGNLESSGVFTPANEIGAFCHGLADVGGCPAGVTPPGIAPYGVQRLNRAASRRSGGTRGGAFAKP